MTAPVASGWSGCRVGLAPTGKFPRRTPEADIRLADFGQKHLRLRLMCRIARQPRGDPLPN